MPSNSNILAIDTSAKSASVAVMSGDTLLAESFMNVGLTHSETLMPLIKSVLDFSGTTLDDIDLFAVSSGPGSFTGLRIGIAAVKGLALPSNTKCAAVSTLLALSYNLIATNGVIVPAMDARRSQVYTAMFQSDANQITRLTDDDAMSIDELGDALKPITKPIFLVGDGAKLCYAQLECKAPNLYLAPPHLLLSRASSVALAAMNQPPAEYNTPATLEPSYLRLAQAERERLERQL